jgi:branched-chain amino acid transport system substrate-binding protein
MTPMIHQKPGNRLRTRKVAAAAALLVLAAACGGSSGSKATSAGNGGKDTGPIRIGVINSYTGAFGLYGKPMEAALRASFAKVHNEVAGRAVELVFEDDATDASTAVSKANKLVDQDHVSMVVCCANGASTLAVGAVLAERKIPQLGPIPNPSGLSKYPTAAVAAPTAGHDATALGKYAATGLKYKRAVVIASDFSYGKEVGAGFASGFTGAGGQVVKTVYAPMNTQDYGSYLSQIPATDVVFAGFAGADAIRFVKQYKQFSGKHPAPLIGHGPLVTELVLKAIGPAAVGVGGGFFYSSSLDNAANKEFITTMKAVNPKFVPSHFTAGAWTVGEVITDAITRLKGQVSDGQKLADAIRATKLDAPWGSLVFDASTGYANAPTYYYTVVADNGVLHHKILATIG